MLFDHQSKPLAAVGVALFMVGSSVFTLAAFGAAPPTPPTLLPIDSTPPASGFSCSNAKQEWIFCSDFEEGSFSIWDDYDGNPTETNRLLSNPGPLNTSGNHVAQLLVPIGSSGADLVKVLPSGHKKLYARWYVQWEPGYDFTAPNHGGGLHAGDRNYLGRSNYRPTGNDWFSAWVEPLPQNKRLNIYAYYRGMYMDCSDPNGSCWGDHFPCMLDEGSRYCTNPAHRETVLPAELTAGKWYCVELMMDAGDPVNSANNANGEMNLWIDGTQLGPWQNMWFRASPNLTFSILWLNLFFHEAHSNAGVLYDDVVVSTSRVQCH